MCIPIYLVLIFILALFGWGNNNSAPALAVAAHTKERVQELITLQARGVPADLVLMFMGYGCEDEQDALDRQTIYYALDFLVLHETVFVFECTCTPPEIPPDIPDYIPPPTECDCEYEPQEPVEYRGKGEILNYLRLTEESGTLTVDNLEDIIAAQAQALCDKSPEDDKREVFIGVLSPNEYEPIVNQYIEDEEDAAYIMDLHNDGYFIRWLIEMAEEYGISSELVFIGKYPMPASGMITSPFGWRIHPITHDKNFHTGIDIGTQKHVDICSVADGVVKKVGTSPYDGRYVLVEHPGEEIPFYSYYAHLSQWKVSPGDTISQGDIVGIEGGDPDDPSPGYSTAHHLHFEIRMSENSNQVNPMTFLRGE